MSVTHLQKHLNCEHTSEGVIKVVEDAVSRALLHHWVLSSQSDGAQADDYHNEEVEVAQIHDPMSCFSQPEIDRELNRDTIRL